MKTLLRPRRASPIAAQRKVTAASTCRSSRKPARSSTTPEREATAEGSLGAANHRPERAHRTPLRRSGRRRTRRTSAVRPRCPPFATDRRCCARRLRGGRPGTSQLRLITGASTGSQKRTPNAPRLFELRGDSAGRHRRDRRLNGARDPRMKAGLPTCRQASGSRPAIPVGWRSAHPGGRGQRATLALRRHDGGIAVMCASAGAGPTLRCCWLPRGRDSCSSWPYECSLRSELDGSLRGRFGAGRGVRR